MPDLVTYVDGDVVTFATSTGEIGAALTAWTPTSLGVNFARYEIEMLDEGETRWDTIAWILDETIDEFSYTAVRRGQLEQFRMRVRLTNGTVSPPTTADTLTIASDRRTRLVAPDVPDVDHFVRIARPGTYTYSRATVETERWGRRYPTVDTDPRDHGERFDGRLHLIAAFEGVVGPRLFDRMRDALNSAAGPFALLTPDGRRRWVRPIFTTGELTIPTYASAGIRFVEIADRPAITIVEAD